MRCRSKHSNLVMFTIYLQVTEKKPQFSNLHFKTQALPPKYWSFNKKIPHTGKKESRDRFGKCGRLHTSDGDQAQSLAERILEHRLAKDPAYPINTHRNPCVTHRAYHCLKEGFKFWGVWITDQIRMALSLRGPGHFTEFKRLLWTHLLSTYRYIWHNSTSTFGPGAGADSMVVG